jgi:hypothetical protein
MNNAQIFTLASLPIDVPKANAVLSATTLGSLAGMSGVSLEASFQYGSGGGTCSAIVATSFDGGTSRRHIARFDFATASAVKVANLNGQLSKGVTVYADLAAEGVLDGILGDQLQVILISTGTYVNTTLSVRASVR